MYEITIEDKESKRIVRRVEGWAELTQSFKEIMDIALVIAAEGAILRGEDTEKKLVVIERVIERG